MAESIEVEIAYADDERQILRKLTCTIGSTVRDVLNASGLGAQLLRDVGTAARIGIFSKIVSLDTCLREGDRVEIYRPLQADPKESRRNRANISSRKP